MSSSSAVRCMALVKVMVPSCINLGKTPRVGAVF
jgi:hypothetical protein